MGGDDATTAVGALLIFGKDDPQPVADVLGSLDVQDMRDVAQGIVQSGGDQTIRLFSHWPDMPEPNWAALLVMPSCMLMRRHSMLL
ncbi:hypothetical protein [Methanogenium cariaci]|uniref:hypothetical protein n=1 Tax=Methanogenium cariaci TaxID=2197 RepID=UPI0012F6717A|nr:hypothetical protein [Methanogenium cariaci]